MISEGFIFHSCPCSQSLIPSKARQAKPTSCLSVLQNSQEGSRTTNLHVPQQLEDLDQLRGDQRVQPYLFIYFTCLLEAND